MVRTCSAFYLHVVGYASDVIMLYLVILRLRTTLAAVLRHRSQRFEVVFAARLTAWLRPDAVIRSQVEHEILSLF